MSPLSISGAAPATLPARLPEPSADHYQHAAYSSLLARFPASLHVAMRRQVPELEKLEQFHQLCVDNRVDLEWVDLLAFMIQAFSDREQVESSRRRAGRMHCLDAHSDGFIDQPDSAGATALHRAVLNWDRELLHELLRLGASPEKILRPDQREREREDLAKLGEGGEGGSESEYSGADLVASAGSDSDDESRSTWQADSAPLEHRIIETLAASGISADVRGHLMRQHAGENGLTLSISSGAPFAVIALLIETCVQHYPRLLTGLDQNGNTPLGLAAANGRVDVLRLLLAPDVKNTAGIDLNQRSGLGRTALMEAVRARDLQAVQLLVQQGSLIELEDPSGHSAVDLAAICSFPDGYAFLSDAVSNSPTDSLSRHFLQAVSACDTVFVCGVLGRMQKELDRDLIRQALSAAVKVRGNAPVARMLLEQLGPTPGTLPLEHAADAEMFDMLADAMVSQTSSGLSKTMLDDLLFHAARTGSNSWIDRAFKLNADVDFSKVANLLPVELARQMIDSLVSRHPRLYEKNGQANTLLDLAVSLKLPGLMSRLVMDGKLDPSHFDRREHSLLLQVMRSDSVELLMALLEPGSPSRQILGAENGNAHAALKVAAKTRQTKMFDLVLNACDVSVHDDAAKTLARLKLAVKVGSAYSCALIHERAQFRLPDTEVRRELLASAVKSGAADVVRYLFESGWYTARQLDEALPALLQQLESISSREVLKVLVDHVLKSPPLPPLLDACLRTAAILFDAAAVAALLERGANPACKIDEKRSVLGNLCAYCITAQNRELSFRSNPAADAKEAPQVLMVLAKAIFRSQLTLAQLSRQYEMSELADLFLILKSDQLEEIAQTSHQRILVVAAGISGVFFFMPFESMKSYYIQQMLRLFASFGTEIMSRGLEDAFAFAAASNSPEKNCSLVKDAYLAADLSLDKGRLAQLLVDAGQDHLRRKIL